VFLNANENKSYRFAVLEAKKLDKTLSEYVPQAVAELYAIARQLKCSIHHLNRAQLMLFDRCQHLRGGLSNGLEWIFILVSVNQHDDGATYQLTRKLVIDTVRDGIFRKVHGQGPDEISGILAHWVSSQFAYLPTSFRQDVAQL
jgi:hypothetical protein